MKISSICTTRSFTNNLSNILLLMQMVTKQVTRLSQTIKEILAHLQLKPPTIVQLQVASAKYLPEYLF